MFVRRSKYDLSVKEAKQARLYAECLFRALEGVLWALEGDFKERAREVYWDWVCDLAHDSKPGNHDCMKPEDFLEVLAFLNKFSSIVNKT